MEPPVAARTNSGSAASPSLMTVTGDPGRHPWVASAARRCVSGRSTLRGAIAKRRDGKRPHSSLDAQTPDHAYFNHLPQLVAARPTRRAPPENFLAPFIGASLRSGLGPRCVTPR